MKIRSTIFTRLSALSAFALLGTATQLLAEEPPVRALLVAGGCCHDYESQVAILREGIQARGNIQVDVIRSEDKGVEPWFPMYEKPDWAKDYDVIIHDECAAGVKDSEYVGNLLGAHKAGLPAVNLHCAMHSYRTGKGDWFEFVGLQSSKHGAQLPIALDFTVATHVITEGMENWTTGNEELYNNIKIFDTATPLVLGEQKQVDGSSQAGVVAWTNDYHGTRVFSTTIGHTNETVADGKYLDLVTRGLLWSLDKLDGNHLTAYTGPQGRFDVIPPTARDGGIVEVPENPTLVTVTASSTQKPNEPDNILDGSLKTRWCAENHKLPQWIQIEFDKETTLTGFEINWETKKAYSGKIEGSSDGETWTILEDFTQNPSDGPTKAEFDSKTVKFVKITCTGTGGTWASIRYVTPVGEGIGTLFSKSAVNAKKDPNAIYEKSGNPLPRIETLSPEQVANILEDVTVPEGFDVNVFSNSAAANYPVYVAAAPNGDVYVSSDGNGSLGREPSRGRIIRLRDTDQDGRADEAIEFVKNIDSPRGLIWDQDRLFVLHPPNISVFTDVDGDGQADTEKTLIEGIAFGFKDRPADHTTNGLTMGIDGWLYIAVGDFGFMDAVGTDGRRLSHRGGGVVRFRPDGTGMELFADGTRNILGTPISPLLDIFARDNTNDGGGWDVRFHHLTGLEDHGYPRMYINFNDEIVQPLADYGGGSGCGAVYLSEPGFPEKWNNAPLTCDWGTGALWHHTVELHGATFKETAPPEPLVKMTRPTDVTVDGMSAIYQASWRGPATFKWNGPDVGYIVRVTPKGYTPEPLPDFGKASDAELVKLLVSSSQVRTLEAQRTLLRREGNPEMMEALLTLAGDDSKELPARVAALYAVTQRATDSASAGSVVEAVVPLASDPLLQRFVLRALGDAGIDRFLEKKTTAPENVFSAGLKSAEPRIRLEAIIGATRQNMVSLAPEIAMLLGDPDPLVAHTAVRSISTLGATEPSFAILDNADSSSAQRTGALRALMRIHSATSVDGLISRMEKETDPTKREGLFAALARLHYHEGEWKGDSWGTRPDTRGPYYQPEEWEETGKVAKVLEAALDTMPAASAGVMLGELKRNRIEMGGGLSDLIELVKKDPALLPEMIAQLATSEDVPNEAIPYLIKAAAGDFPAQTISTAVSVLSTKTNSQEGVTFSLAALERLSKMEDAKKEFDSAKAAFLTSPKLENHHQFLEAEAEKMNGAISMWADAGLLALSTRKTGAPESAAESKSAIDSGWAEPKRRVQILNAILATGFHGLDDKVRAAVTDADASVADAAKKAASALKLDEKNTDTTPLVSSMTQEEAVAAVLKTKGDVGVGEQMFTRQSCVACHAVSLDQVQKGPYLGSIAKTYNREDLAVSIMEPAKTIAQGFATELFTLKDGSSQMGFVTFEGADLVKARNIAGEEMSWKTADITKREKLPISLMPPGLASSMTIREFASLLDYLEALSK